MNEFQAPFKVSNFFETFHLRKMRPQTTLSRLPLSSSSQRSPTPEEPLLPLYINF